MRSVSCQPRLYAASVRTNSAASSVSVGIPTFNRAITLERALGSLLAQTHSNLEIIVSDNASSDDTEALCRMLAAQDARVRYMRQAQNIGQTANFNAVFAELRSPYVMVLADDDWVAPDYVERCLSALQQQPDCVAVSGRGRYWQGETMLTRRGLDFQLPQRESMKRVHAYFRVVGSGEGENSTFFGVMPAEVLRRATPMPNALGNDMLVTARVVFQGPVRTLDDVHLNRSVGGISVSTASIVATLDLPSRQASFPSFVIAGHVLRDVGWRNPVYATLSPAARLGWGLRCALAAIDWQSVGWHATAPLAARLGRRPWGRWIWSAYEGLVRTLKARRFKEVR
jgi:glycosyltransferase involved in cell wall biosynthesis